MRPIDFKLPYRWRTFIRQHTPWWLIDLGFAEKRGNCEAKGGFHEWYNVDGVHSACYHCSAVRKGRLWESASASVGPVLQYHELNELQDLYLEDSWVLGVKEDDRTVIFDLEFVLTPNHPNYTPSKPGLQHCYKRGRLAFPNVRNRNWIAKHFIPSTDTSGKIDYGNIDVFTYDATWSKLEGSWGAVHIQSDRPVVILDDC